MTIAEVLFDNLAADLESAAFPIVIDNGERYCVGTGLTKRELFAAMLLQGFASNGHGVASSDAEYAAAMADALIAALNPKVRAEEKP